MPNTERQQAQVLRRLFGVSERGPVIYYVHPNSAAAVAGLQDGDIILAVAGSEIPRSGQAARDAMKNLRPAPGEPVTMRVLRSARELEVTLAHERQCDAIPAIATDGRVHAYVKDATVAVTTGMLDFTKTDDELAFVVGHELAHFILARMDSRERAALFAGQPWHASRDESKAQLEREADHLGVILAARAGYDVSLTAAFWRRMAVEHPSSIKATSAYPSTAECYLAVDAVVKHVSECRKSGQPLLQGHQDQPLRLASKPPQDSTPPEAAAQH